MISEVEQRPTHSASPYKVIDHNSLKQLLNLDDETELILVDSGKAAISIILDFFRSIGRLPNKNSELLVPQWIGSWVYNIIIKKCFPANLPNINTSGVMIYHQYGFPQNMVSLMAEARKKNWFIIEDCAHAIMTFDNKQRLGLIGDAGVFSFSKFFPSLMGGAIITRRKDLADFARGKSLNYIKWCSDLSYWSKWISSSNYVPRTMKRHFNTLTEMSYNIYDRGTQINPRALTIIVNELRSSSLEIRKENAEYFCSELTGSGVIEIPSKNEITPYVVPFFGEKSHLETLRTALAGINIKTGIYQFDTNYNMLTPKFEPCIWLPVHTGVSHALRTQIVEIIRNRKS